MKIATHRQREEEQRDREAPKKSASSAPALGYRFGFTRGRKPLRAQASGRAGLSTL